MAASDAEAELVSAVSNPRDSTRIISELQRRNAELAAAVAARDAFLAIAAHELRNPMTPIVGHVQRLRRLVASRACSLDEIERGLSRIDWLIELYLKRATTLLDVSRITSGKLRLEISQVDIAAMARGITAGLEPAAQHVGSTLSLDLPPTFEVATDRLAFEQILDNLLLNAVKYGAGKPIALSISSDDDVFRLQVRDEGIGMSPQDQQRIFEPFERALEYGATTGFGVGLWVVRQLVDALGGEIRVESMPNVGTTFTVTLPRKALLGP